MKRIGLWIGIGIGTAAIAVLTVLLLTTCVFNNHRFQPATCTEPETCTRCGITRATPLGHTYAPATCTEPETCVRCGLTQGEALGHVFASATCTEPETCLRCGETQGEPLGHLMSEATYQSPSTCLRCGITEGEPLVAVLSHTALHELEIGKPVPYTTASYEDHDVDVTGTVEIVDYETIAGNDVFPAREGYEWHVATVRLVFAGNDAQQNGMQSALTYGDFYATDAEMGTTVDENGLRPFVVNWYGSRVQCWQKTGPDEEGDWFGHELRFAWKEGVLVPEGYDGTLLIFYNYRLAKNADRLFLPAGEVLDENALVFRMK